MKRGVDYKEGLIKRLGDHVYAAHYLNAALEDTDSASNIRFLIALRDVAIANGVTNLARKTKLGRESLYKTLSKAGNPTFLTLISILNAIGLKLAIKKAA